ncbi:DUF6233 domain-containing protein [Streptomyces sp. NPDC056149]|uniref:DUF6233 domain-containing protein n=1 Tax=Streptomyces sp. NPDC056149 TaxID=3345728 RepID=UPI0035E30BE4
MRKNAGHQPSPRITQPSLQGVSDFAVPRGVSKVKLTRKSNIVRIDPWSVVVHHGQCATGGRRKRPVSRRDAIEALAAGVHPCAFYYPDRVSDGVKSHDKLDGGSPGDSGRSRHISDVDGSLGCS